MTVPTLPGTRHSSIAPASSLSIAAFQVEWIHSRSSPHRRRLRQRLSSSCGQRLATRKTTIDPPEPLGHSASGQLLISARYSSPPFSFAMNVWTATLPLKLRIWQQNAHKSKMAHSYILNTANPNNWDVIALQEPWIDSYGNSHGTQFWKVVYPANFYVEGRNRVRSISLINTNISTDSYSILPVMHSDITAVCFKGEHRFLSLSTSITK